MNIFFKLTALLRTIFFSKNRSRKIVNEKNSIMETIAKNGEDATNEQINTPVLKNMREVRLSGIYQTVLDYMEHSKPFVDPDYSLDRLAADLKINKAALSASLNSIGTVSFKDLLNSYRIREAKVLLMSDEFGNNYIKQTYLSAGFKYHTTFNRVFKKSEGMTPTEYIVIEKNKRMKSGKN